MTEQNKDAVSVKEMVGQIDRMIRDPNVHWGERPKATLQAIKRHIQESDIAHWMDRCHELEEKLREKPNTPRVNKEKVSREEIFEGAYDPNANALYVKFSNQKIKRTMSPTDNCNVDLDKNDRVVGIEILGYKCEAG